MNKSFIFFGILISLTSSLSFGASLCQSSLAPSTYQVETLRNDLFAGFRSAENTQKLRDLLLASGRPAEILEYSPFEGSQQEIAIDSLRIQPNGHLAVEASILSSISTEIHRGFAVVEIKTSLDRSSTGEGQILNRTYKIAHQADFTKRYSGLSLDSLQDTATTAFVSPVSKIARFELDKKVRLALIAKGIDADSLQGNFEKWTAEADIKLKEVSPNANGDLTIRGSAEFDIYSAQSNEYISHGAHIRMHFRATQLNSNFIDPTERDNPGNLFDPKRGSLHIDSVSFEILDLFSK